MQPLYRIDDSILSKCRFRYHSADVEATGRRTQGVTIHLMAGNADRG